MRFSTLYRHVLRVLLVAAMFVLASCSGGTGDPDASPSPAATGGRTQLRAEMASFDLAAGSEQRVIVGLITSDNEFIGNGTIQTAFAYLGDGEQPAGNGQTGTAVTADYLPIPGSPPPDPNAKPGVVPADARGVYAARTTFDKPGWWGVALSADLQDGGPTNATATFEVAAKHKVPAVGDQAPRTQNLTADSPGVQPGAIDSRAVASGKLPDPELHQTTIAEVLDAKRPAVVAFTTPVYCESRFCGPITEMIADLAGRYGDQAEFLHVEIWKDRPNDVINKGAADWLLHDGNMNEPWVFVIDANGQITARFDNITTQPDLEAALAAL